MTDRRFCGCGCGEIVTGRRKYANDTHRARAHARKVREAEKIAIHDPTRIRRGSAYRLIESYGLYDLFADGKLSAHGVLKEVEERTGESFALQTIVTALHSHRIDRRIRKLDESWEMSADVRRVLCLDPWPNPHDEAEAFEAWLDQAIEAFCEFEGEFFRMARGPYIRKPFHKRWIRGILRKLAAGGKLNILAPPRHGKTELLLHFVVWLICRDPEIRILWISLNDDIAGDPVEAIREVLETDEKLIRAVLPPSQSFAPQSKRGARSWQSKKITVACRQIKGNKSPTVLGVGRGGSILSKDVDLIITDDIEDHKSTEGEASRRSTKKYASTQVGSRWEEHTAWVNIGSRQHPDDLHGDYLEDDEWESIVEQAHDPQCPGGWDDKYDHTDCMLFPEVRTFRWLSKLRKSFIAQNLEHLFYMVYQNDPQPEGIVMFTRELVEKSYNPTRGLGVPDLPNGRSPYLVAGLDPSAVNRQAAYAVAVDLDPELETGRRYMIDIDNNLGGGVDPFLEVAERWRVDYGIKHWVIEITMYRTGFLNDPRVVEWVAKHGIIIEETDTQGNSKRDVNFGIGAMRRLFGKRIAGDTEDPPVLIDLPTGTTDARAKTESFVKQLIGYTEDIQLVKRRKTDILMASWFTEKVVRRWIDDWIAMLEYQMRPDDELSYAGFGQTDWDDVPW